MGRLLLLLPLFPEDTWCWLLLPLLAASCRSCCCCPRPDDPAATVLLLVLVLLELDAIGFSTILRLPLLRSRVEVELLFPDVLPLCDDVETTVRFEAVVALVVVT
uniref:Putative secreted protein n=1 Tax=Anopheles darlingi TaxID=43151 RepID=A0A2M4D1X7_ANODA